eukprot:tig00000367_g24456.t1
MSKAKPATTPSASAEPDIETPAMKELNKKNMAGVATTGRTEGEELTRRIVLGIGDASVFLSFAYIGRGFHAGTWVPDVDMLVTAAPFVAGWFLSAPLTGAYKPEATSSWGGVGKYTGLAGAGALLAGMGLRSVQLGHPPPTSFFIATAVYTFLVLGLWRSLYSILERRNESKSVRRARGPFAVLEMVLSLIKRW